MYAVVMIFQVLLEATLRKVAWFFLHIPGSIVQRLRHRAFNSGIAVRLRMELLNFWDVSSVGRAPALQAGCQRFESATLH